MRISKLLMGDHRGFSNVIAKAFGVNEAIALNQIDYWLEYNARDRGKKETHFVDGRWWVFNTYEDWQSENFDFWSISTIKRVFSGLEAGQDPVLLSRKFGSKKGKHTKWYSIDYDALDRAIRPYMPDSVNLSQSRSGQSDTIRSGQSDTIRSGQSDTIRSGQSDTIRNGSTCTNLDRVNLEFSYKETETTSETTSSETTDREKSFFPQTDFADAQCEPEPPIEIRVTPAPNQNTLVAQRSGSEGTSIPGGGEPDAHGEMPPVGTGELELSAWPYPWGVGFSSPDLGFLEFLARGHLTRTAKKGDPPATVHTAKRWLRKARKDWLRLEDAFDHWEEYQDVRNGVTPQNGSEQAFQDIMAATFGDAITSDFDRQQRAIMEAIA